jgi:hypothetical protein
VQPHQDDRFRELLQRGLLAEHLARLRADQLPGGRPLREADRPHLRPDIRRRRPLRIHALGDIGTRHTSRHPRGPTMTNRPGGAFGSLGDNKLQNPGGQHGAGGNVEPPGSCSAQDRALRCGGRVSRSRYRSSGRSPTWPGRSVRSRSHRPRRRHQPRRNGQKRPREASRPRPMSICVVGQVVHPGVHWAICRDSEGTRFGIAGPTPAEHRKRQRGRASPPTGHS